MLLTLGCPGKGRGRGDRSQCPLLCLRWPWTSPWWPDGQTVTVITSWHATTKEFTYACILTYRVLIGNEAQHGWCQTIGQRQTQHDQSHIARWEIKLDGEESNLALRDRYVTLFPQREELGYRVNSKQGQGGIQEAQSCTEGEDHVADKDHFCFGEETEEWIPRSIGLCTDGSTKRSPQVRSEDGFLGRPDERRCWRLLPMLGRTNMLKGTMTMRRHPRSKKGTS